MCLPYKRRTAKDRGVGPWECGNCMESVFRDQNAKLGYKENLCRVQAQAGVCVWGGVGAG